MPETDISDHRNGTSAPGPANVWAIPIKRLPIHCGKVAP
jgi:hypothetical protein